MSTYCCLHHLCPPCSHHLNTFKYVDIVFFLQPVQCSVYGNECASTTGSSTGWKEGACIDQVRLCFVNYGCLYMFVSVASEAYEKWGGHEWGLLCCTRKCSQTQTKWRLKSATKINAKTRFYWSEHERYLL